MIEAESCWIMLDVWLTRFILNIVIFLKNEVQVQYLRHPIRSDDILSYHLTRINLLIVVLWYLSKGIYQKLQINKLNWMHVLFLYLTIQNLVSNYSQIICLTTKKHRSPIVNHGHDSLPTIYSIISTSSIAPYTNMDTTLMLTKNFIDSPRKIMGNNYLIDNLLR